MVLVHDDFVTQNVNNVGVVPDGFRREDIAANFQTVDLVVVRPVEPDQRAAVVSKLRKVADAARAPPGVSLEFGEHGIRINMNDAALVIAKRVVHDDWLRLPHKDRRCVGGPASVPTAAIARFVGFKRAVGDTNVGLVVDLDRVKAVDRACDRRLSATKGDIGIVDAAARSRVENQTTPVATCRTPCRLIVCRVERPACSVPIILNRRDDDRIFFRAFRDDMSIPAQRFDAGRAELHSDARIDRQSTARPGNAVQRAAGIADDFQVLGDHMDDVGIVKASRKAQSVDPLSERRQNPDKDSVEGVVDQNVAVKIGTNPAAGIIKRIRVSRHRRGSIVRQIVVRDCRPARHKMNGRERLLDRVNDDPSTTVLNRRLIDVVQEDPRIGRRGADILEIRIRPENEPAPVFRLSRRSGRVAVAADRIVFVGSKLNFGARRPQDLQRTTTPVDTDCRRSDINVCAVKFDDRAGVDLHRHVFGNLKFRTVFQSSRRIILAKQVRSVIAERQHIVVRSTVANDADDVAWRTGCHGTAHQTERVRF